MFEMTVSLLTWLYHRGSKTFEVASQFCEVASMFFYVGSTVFLKYGTCIFWMFLRWLHKLVKWFQEILYGFHIFFNVFEVAPQICEMAPKILSGSNDFEIWNPYFLKDFLGGFIFSRWFEIFLSVFTFFYARTYKSRVDQVRNSVEIKQ